jgi:hypothetical protein
MLILNNYQSISHDMYIRPDSFPNSPDGNPPQDKTFAKAPAL